MEFKVMDYEIFENENGDVSIMQDGDVLAVTYDQLPLFIEHLQEMKRQHEAENTAGA